MRRAAIALVLLGGVAHADFVRGTVKIDVRSPDGRPQEAKVTLRLETPTETVKDEPRPVSRTGEVYVAEGLVDGVWRVEVEGAPAQLVRVRSREVSGAVAVLGGKKRAPTFTVGPDEPACLFDGGQVVEAVAFAHGGLAAGRLEVRRGKKLLCAATVAGGGASLRLQPGEYTIDVKLAGGGSAHASYHLRDGKAPPPLVLRGKER